MPNPAAKTATVSSMKIAVALAFLGAANLLAAASMINLDLRRIKRPIPTPPPLRLVLDKPDLVIDNLSLNTDGNYDGMSDLELTVSYKNIGKATVNQPFRITITSEPAGLFGEAGLTLGQADQFGAAGLANKFNLAPGENAAMKVLLFRNNAVGLEGEVVRLFAYADFVDQQPNGSVPELDEMNNENNFMVGVATPDQVEAAIEESADTPEQPIAETETEADEVE